MSRGKEFAKNTAIIAFGKISTQFISFFLLPLYTALLSTEEYGIVDVFNTCVTLLLPIITLQLDQGVFRFLVDVRGEKEKQQELITSVTAFIIVQCMVCIVGYVLVAPLLQISYKIYILLNLIVNSLSATFLQISRGLGNNLVYSLGSFLTAAVSIALNVLFIAGLKMGGEGMLLATFIGHVVCCAFLFFSLKLYAYFRRASFNKSTLKKIFVYSLPLVPNAISWWLINASDRLIVANYLGLGANGILSVAHKFPSVYTAIFQIINMTWIESATMYMNKEGGKEFFCDMINVLQKLLTSLFLGIVAIMPFVFPFLVNSAYSEAYHLIPIYMLSSVISASVYLISVVYTVKLATKEIAKTTIFSGLINIAVHLLLIRMIGMYAAPVSTVIAYLVMAVYRYRDSQKYYRYRLDLKFIGAAIVLYAGVCFCYYNESMVMHIIAFGITVIFVVFANRKILFNIAEFVGEIKKGRRKK